jgi:hypothetical protein
MRRLVVDGYTYSKETRPTTCALPAYVKVLSKSRGIYLTYIDGIEGIYE